MRFILVGCGHISKKHLTEIYRTGELVAVCDSNEKNIIAIGIDTDKVKVYSNYKSLLSSNVETDVVVLCTPNYLHADQSIAAIENNYHVLCEKPMAITSADCKKMIDSAEKHNKALSIVKQIRFNPSIQALKKWIAEGKSGKIYSVSLHGIWNRNKEYYQSSDWRGNKNRDGGILYTQFSHFVDLLIWLFGEVKHIYSIKNNVSHPISQIEDQLVSAVEFSSGALGTAHFTVNSFEKNLETSILVNAEHGTIKIGGMYCDHLELSNTRKNDFFIKQTPSNTGHAAVYNHFIQGIQSKTYDRKSLYEAMDAVKLIERMYETSF